MVRLSECLFIYGLMTEETKRHCFYGITEKSIEIVKIYAAKRRIKDGKAISEIIEQWNNQVNKNQEGA